jgi:hypothetical protein
VLCTSSGTPQAFAAAVRRRGGRYCLLRWETTIVKLWVAVPSVFVAVMVTG